MEKIKDIILKNRELKKQNNIDIKTISSSLSLKYFNRLLSSVIIYHLALTVADIEKIEVQDIFFGS